jgi:excinuclease ABC subunit C
MSTRTDNYEALKNDARNAPLEPGVYIWKDEEGRPIYIGKARMLRNRLGSYFSGSRDVKTAALIRHACSIETIIVPNEYEALLLENTLIKQHSPKYNINLKDGKTYPVIRITSGDFPKVFRTRHIVEDGSLYFGPYPNIQGVDKLLELVEKLFPLRKCRTLKKRSSPCMYYHIGRCQAPCCGRIKAADYEIQVERVRKLLAGETGALVSDLTGKMKEAAKALKFEEAARLRNAVRAIEELSEPRSVEDRDPEARDYLAWASEGIFTVFSVFSMREGRMTGRELFSSRSAAEEGESLETFITAYYSPDRPPPPKIYLALPASGREGFDSLGQYFTGQFGYAPELLPPQDGDASRRHTAALAMARQNAVEELRRRLRERGAGPALDELGRVLGLEARPEHIEGFDIAQLDGRSPVASLIAFKNGVPDRKNYRHFKLRTVVGIVDDFAAMREAVQRRYSRLLKEGKELPDLVLVDGGIGQVNAARAVMDELGMGCGVAGLAKKDEEIWLPGAREPLRLSRRSEALKVLQFVRDEAHRFATGLNQKLRSGGLAFPVLESLEGIGPKRAAAVMKAYESIENIAAAEYEEIAERCGIPQTAARAVRAAAKLALENRKAAKEQFASGTSAPRRRPRAGYSGKSAEDLADEAFAAENRPDYEKGGDTNASPSPARPGRNK